MQFINWTKKNTRRKRRILQQQLEKSRNIKLGKRRMELKILLQYDARLYQWKEGKHMHTSTCTKTYTHTCIHQMYSMCTSMLLLYVPFPLYTLLLAQIRIYFSNNKLIAPHFHSLSNWHTHTQIHAIYSECVYINCLFECECVSISVLLSI